MWSRSRPGVATTISAPPRSARSCMRISTPPSTAGRMAGRRGSAPRAASVAFDRPGFFPDLDRARLDELLERGVLDVVRGYLSALSRSQVQRLAARQGNAQGLRCLVGDGRHGGSFSADALLPAPSRGLL